MNGLYHLKTDRGAGRGREGGRETEGGRGGEKKGAEEGQEEEEQRQKNRKSALDDRERTKRARGRQKLTTERETRD